MLRTASRAGEVALSAGAAPAQIAVLGSIGAPRPADVQAVVLHVTLTEISGSGTATISPGGGADAVTHFAFSGTNAVSNLVVSPVDAAGRIAVRVDGASAHVRGGHRRLLLGHPICCGRCFTAAVERCCVAQRGGQCGCHGRCAAAGRFARRFPRHTGGGIWRRLREHVCG